jgi:hypothetical protein
MIEMHFLTLAQFTIRMAGIRKYMTNFFSTDLQKDDLVMSRIHATMDDFNFAPRRELGMGLDVAFKLHGTTIMFYHFDKNFFVSLLGCKDKAHAATYRK